MVGTNCVKKGLSWNWYYQTADICFVAKGLICGGVSHYRDVIMGKMASQITSLTIVYSAVYSGEGQRKHQSSASLAFVRGFPRGPMNFPHKWPVMRKMFPFDDVIMIRYARASNTEDLWNNSVVCVYIFNLKPECGPGDLCLENETSGQNLPQPTMETVSCLEWTRKRLFTHATLHQSYVCLNGISKYDFLNEIVWIWFKHIYFNTIGEQLYNYTSPLVGVTANHTRTHTIVHITKAIMIITMSQLQSKQFGLRSKWQIGIRLNFNYQFIEIFH